MAYSCRNCNSTRLASLIDLGSMPIAHRLLEERDQEEEVFPFSVSYCRACGMAQIVNPISADVLYLDYNYCFTSWKAEPHRIDEVQEILSLGPSVSVFEIAANDGSFLHALREAGAVNLIGLEPNQYTSKLAADRGFPIYNHFLTPAVCRQVIADHGHFDVVVARQVIEHLIDLGQFYECLVLLLKPNGHLFVDAPNVQEGFRHGDISVLWEEHVNYFTPETLAASLGANGFQVISERHYNFSGGIMSAFARRNISHDPETSPAIESILRHCGDYKSKVEAYRQKLFHVFESWRGNGGTIVLYGAGCRGCSFVNGLRLNDKWLDFAVDDQEARQEKFVPGARLPIHSPKILKDQPGPLLVLLAVNNENEGAVSSRLSSLERKDLKALSVLTPGNLHEKIRSLQLEC